MVNIFRGRLCGLYRDRRFAYFSLLAPKLQCGPVLGRSRAEFLDRTTSAPPRDEHRTFRTSFEALTCTVLPYIMKIVHAIRPVSPQGA